MTSIVRGVANAVVEDVQEVADMIQGRGRYSNPEEGASSRAEEKVLIMMKLLVGGFDV